MFKKTRIDELVKEIAQRETKPMIAVSIDQIADEIEKSEGKRPSKAAIWSALYRLGAISSGRKFIYKWHNPQADE